MTKRYVLLLADRDLGAEELTGLSESLELRFGKSKVIVLKGNPRAVVVRTTNRVAPMLRGQDGALVVGGTKLTPELTSGSIGKLKRRASATQGSKHGQVHE